MHPASKLVELYVCDEYCDRRRDDGSWDLHRRAASDALKEEARTGDDFWITHLVSGKTFLYIFYS